MMSPDSVPSAMPLNRECVEEEEELWNGDSENEECDEIHSIEDGNEATEICEDRIEEPKEGMTFDTSEDAHLYYFNYAKQKGFAVATRTSRKGKDGKLKNVILSCNRAGKARVTTSNPVKPRPQSKIDCPAHITVVLYPDGKWRFNRVYLEHNHEQSPTKARFFRCNRVLNEDVKKRLDVNDRAGIKLCKTFDSLQVEAGGPGELPYLQKDCRNYLDKQRRLRLVEGDAEAMHSYFVRMRNDNSDFFFDMDLNEKGRLRNVFWADARSRAVCKEFGDVVAFDTTYLLNRQHYKKLHNWRPECQHTKKWVAVEHVSVTHFDKLIGNSLSLVNSPSRLVGQLSATQYYTYSNEKMLPLKSLNIWRLDLHRRNVNYFGAILSHCILVLALVPNWSPTKTMGRHKKGQFPFN